MAGKLRFDIPGKPIVKRTRKPWGVFFQRDEADGGMLAVFDTEIQAKKVLDRIAQRGRDMVHFIVRGVPA